MARFHFALVLCCLAACFACSVCVRNCDSLALRLRGGTGQGGPSRGFRSKNGSRRAWRHPHTLFEKSNKPDGPRPREHLANRKTILMTGKVTAYQSAFKNRKRSHQPWYLKFTSARGKRWLDEALKDDAFRLGAGARVEAHESMYWNDWKANAKTPKAWKTGKGGWGKPVHDFTNKYLGVKL